MQRLGKQPPELLPTGSAMHQNPDGCHVGARRERPSRRAEQRDELPACHSITSSASESRLSEILTPSAFAVLTLITSSNFVGCNTGMSAGFSPFKIRAVYMPRWR